MHNLKYAKIIVDCDSSVYKKIEIQNRTVQIFSYKQLNVETMFCVIFAINSEIYLKLQRQT
jgi:hypothetical protein